MIEIANNDFYSMKVDESKNRFYLTIEGFWETGDQVPEYLDDLKKAVKHLSNGFTILSDLIQMKTPTQEIGALHVKAQKYLIDSGLSKTAEVHPLSMIAKMTVDRFSEESGMKKGMFSSKEEAEKWLNA
ncbi:MAG: hypothetical protein JXB88_05330 [Spirochaetales bacterium]|nr:hypothetical protein [Spirochaetales bacterium]